MMMKFRFLDPFLAQRYDSDGLATALFTFCGYNSGGHWPRTIIVPYNVMEQLRSVLLTTMTFGCMDSGRKEVLSRLVDRASFHAQVVSRQETTTTTTTTTSNGVVNNASRLENAAELNTCEDVRNLLQGFCMGDDIKIWIDTSGEHSNNSNNSNKNSPASPSSPPTGFGNENSDPNKRNSQQEQQHSAPNLPLPQKPAVSASLKAIAKVGNVQPARETLAQEKKREQAEDTEENVKLDSEMAAASPSVHTPGFPGFAEFCYDLDASAHTIATTAAVTITSISSSLANEDFLQDGRNPTVESDGQDDSETEELRQILALAGCAHLNDLCGVTDHREDDFLSGLWACDEKCPSDEESHTLAGLDCCSGFVPSTLLRSNGDMDTGNGSNTHKDDSITNWENKSHLLPSFFETKTSLTSVSSSSYIGDPMDCGSWSVDSSNSECFSAVPSMHIGSNNAGSHFPCSRKDAIICESSSLLEGHELEMTTIVESVLDSVFVQEDASANDDAADHGAPRATKIAHLCPSEHSESCPDIPYYPCPSPKELLDTAMGWNDDLPNQS